MFHHNSHQFGEGRLTRIPPQKGLGLGGVAQQLLDLGGTEEARVDSHKLTARSRVDTYLVDTLTFPAEFDAHLAEGQCRKFPHGMVFAGGDDKIFGCIVLEYEPHALDIVLAHIPSRARH